MLSSLSMRRHAAFKPALLTLSLVTCALALALAKFGALTTTIGAGMVFADWPLSNGSINPEGWLQDSHMLAEHGHRLLATLVGLCCIALAVMAQLRESRPWVRLLAWGVLGLVIFQGLLGGMRVLFVSVDLALVHGVLAQIFLCSLAALAFAVSRRWRDVVATVPDGGRFEWARQRRLGLVVCALLLVQLTLGAALRHYGAGLAIPYYPHATADGSWLPAAWNWATILHFTHRWFAIVVAAALLFFALGALRSPWAGPVPRTLAKISLGLVAVQVLLGASVIWSLRGVTLTNLHVVNGALLLVAAWLTTLTYFRPLLASERPVEARVLRPTRPFVPVASEVLLRN